MCIRYGKSLKEQKGHNCTRWGLGTEKYSLTDDPISPAFSNSHLRRRERKLHTKVLGHLNGTLLCRGTFEFFILSIFCLLFFPPYDLSICNPWVAKSFYRHHLSTIRISGPTIGLWQLIDLGDDERYLFDFGMVPCNFICRDFFASWYILLCGRAALWRAINSTIINVFRCAMFADCASGVSYGLEVFKPVVWKADNQQSEWKRYDVMMRIVRKFYTPSPKLLIRQSCLMVLWGFLRFFAWRL